MEASEFDAQMAANRELEIAVLLEIYVSEMADLLKQLAGVSNHPDTDDPLDLSESVQTLRELHERLEWMRRNIHLVDDPDARILYRFALKMRSETLESLPLHLFESRSNSGDDDIRKYRIKTRSYEILTKNAQCIEEAELTALTLEAFVYAKIMRAASITDTDTSIAQSVDDTSPVSPVLIKFLAGVLDSEHISILRYLAVNNCINEASARKQPVIVGDLDMDENSIKRWLGFLGKLRLTDSKRSQNGGNWITVSGLSVVKFLDQQLGDQSSTS